MKCDTDTNGWNKNGLQGVEAYGSLFIMSAQVWMDAHWLTKFKGAPSKDWDVERPGKGFMSPFFSQHPLRSLGIRWWKLLQERTPGLLCFPWCGFFFLNGPMKEELLLPGCVCLCNSSWVGCSWQVRNRSRVSFWIINTCLWLDWFSLC